MVKAQAVVLVQLLTAGVAIGWAYASHQNDCFNVGGCRGDPDFWIRVRDYAFYFSLGLWAVLLLVTALYSRHASGRSRVFAWVIAGLLPPAVLFSSHWLLKLGTTGHMA